MVLSAMDESWLQSRPRSLLRYSRWRGRGMSGDAIKVVAQRDTFLRIARARPLTAIAELIWNSLDADANNVTVYFDENELGLRGVVVEDDGQGATPDEAKEFFRRLGGSWKKPGGRTKKHGRVLHGNQGQGRYKALSVGRSIKWTYFYEQGEDIYEFTLSILGDDPSEVSTPHSLMGWWLPVMLK